MGNHLSRWITASLAVYFKAIADSLSLILLVEGVDERSGEDMTASHAELRVSGPFTREVSKNYWRTHVSINVMLTNFMQQSSENAYTLNTWGDAFLAAMMEPIPVYRYGDGPEDDETLVGCLTQQKNVSEPVRLIHFGQISRVERVRQAVVDGKFEFFTTVE